jgi:hypothetical protein
MPVPDRAKKNIALCLLCVSVVNFRAMSPYNIEIRGKGYHIIKKTYISDIIITYHDFANFSAQLR